MENKEQNLQFYCVWFSGCYSHLWVLEIPYLWSERSKGNWDNERL